MDYSCLGWEYWRDISYCSKWNNYGNWCNKWTWHKLCGVVVEQGGLVVVFEVEIKQDNQVIRYGWSGEGTAGASFSD